MIKRRYTRAGKVAAIISPHLDDRQTVTTTVLEQTTGEESGGAVQNVNVVTETLAAATHRGDQIFGAEKMAKFNNKGELGASLLRAGRDDKTRSVNAEDWHENAAAIFKNTIAFLGKDRGAAFIRAYGSLLEIAASDPDGFGKAMVSVGRNVFFADGNLGIGTVPAAPLHVAKTGDQVVLEDGDGSATRLRSDAGGFTATPENGVSTFSGKIVSAEPDGTTTTLSEGGVVRESGITEGYYQKRGVILEGNKTTAQAHSIDGQARLMLRALKGYLPGAESSDYPYIDVYSADEFYTTFGGVSIHAPRITLDPGEGGINGDLNFTGNATFSDVVLPANTGMGWNRTGHLKIAVSSGAPTSPEDGQMWVTSNGLFIRAGGVTYGPLAAALANGVSGSLTSGKLPKSSGTNALTDSVLSESGGTVTLDGGLTINGNARRITGLFASSPISNRILFQSSISGVTSVGVIPAGSGGSSNLRLMNLPDADNATALRVEANSTETHVDTVITGTSALVPFRLKMATSTRVELDTSGNIALTPAAQTSFADATNIVMGTTTGTKIGTATTQKIGFFGATPVVQQTGGAATAAATYGTNERDMLQRVYNALRALGLIS